MSAAGCSPLTRSFGPNRGHPRRCLRRPSLDRLLNLHDAYLARLRDHFLVGDDIGFEDSRHEVLVEGRLRFVHGLILDVQIGVAVDADRRVQVDSYTFHAGFELDRHRPMFRDDNAHAYPRHPDAHDKHLCDPLDPDALGAVEWIGAEREPSLGEVMDELFA